MGHEADPATKEQGERSDQRMYSDVGRLVTESGAEIPSVTIAYQTWGQLSSDRDNAILVCHALSGDADCADWWPAMVGPGKGIDTDRFFVIGSNCLGGCRGSTGPPSRHPDGGTWGRRFPIITIGDMVECQFRLVRSLGIDTLLGACGGSMGGMQALEWSLRKPGSVRKVWMTGCTRAHNAMQIALNEVGRQAIMRDPAWKNGEYALDEQPAGGLGVARMMGHISYLSAESFATKFGRGYQDKAAADWTLGTEFQVESYLDYQASKFTRRFDANSYLYLTRALDYYDCQSFDGSQSEYMFTSFTSDWLYPSSQSRELLHLAQEAGCKASHTEIDLPYGHDAFLLDAEHQGALASQFFAG